MAESNGLSEKLIAAYDQGCFLSAVYELLIQDTANRGKLSSLVATLHNEGIVDAVEAFMNLKAVSNNGPDFFMTRHVLEEALPNLDAPVDRIVRCVEQLCRDAGQDMAAGTILNGYIEYCSKDPNRPKDALSLIANDPDALSQMLPATITAGSKLDCPFYVRALLSLTKHSNLSLRGSSIYSFSKVIWPEEGDMRIEAFAALEDSVSNELDGWILGNAVKSAFSLASKSKILIKRCDKLIGEALAKGNEQTLHGASEIFWMNTKELWPSLLEVLISYLPHVKKENAGTVRNLDFGIGHLVELGKIEESINLLGALFQRDRDAISFSNLNGTAARIRQNPQLIAKLLTRWFLSGDRALCKAVGEIVSKHHNREMRIEIDASEIGVSDFAHIVFLGHKAIGYLFMNPITAASVVVSLMRHAPDDETLGALGDLILDPLLISYPGSLRDYLLTEAPKHSRNIGDTITNRLAAFDEYLAALQSIPNLPALHPSESNREIFNRNISESMAKSLRMARKESVLLSLISQVTLLYGRKSINYVHGGEGKTHRTETRLQEHGVEMEFPRMDSIDQSGLDYKLRVFRAEQLRK